jgi:hypothetical protein
MGDRVNLYRIEYGMTDRTVKPPVERILRCWAGTQADMKKRAKELTEAGAYDIAMGPMEVPTDKAGLLAWLNSYEVLG